MNDSDTTTSRIACRIGPVVLAAEDEARAIALAPDEPEAPVPERALDDFAFPDRPVKRTSRTQRTTGEKTTTGTTTTPRTEPDFVAPGPAAPCLDEPDRPDPALVVKVERGIPASRPDSPVVFRHRAGWDVYRSENALTAIKAIPYGSGRLLRSVEMGLDGGEAVLRVAPEDDRASLPFAYTLSELLVLLLTRRSRALLAHSACVEIAGRALLFAGTSGTGKSTLAALWEESAGAARIPARARVLGDESHLIWSDAQGRIWVSGTPWPGSSGLFSNRIAPLERIFFLEHGRENAARPLDAADAMVALLSQSFLPTWDAESLRAVTDLAARIAERIPAARLAFVPDGSVVEFLTGHFGEKGR